MSILSLWAKKTAVSTAAQTAVDTRALAVGAVMPPHSTLSRATATTTMSRKGQAGWPGPISIQTAARAAGRRIAADAARTPRSPQSNLLAGDKDVIGNGSSETTVAGAEGGVLEHQLGIGRLPKEEVG
jgi:hypothetical protein